MHPTILFVWLLSAVVAVHSRDRPGGRIVGGTVTTINEYPYQLSLRFYGFHFCGASVVSANWALTAAHCTYKIPVRSLSIRCGSSYWNRGGSIVQVERKIEHEGYKNGSYDNDIAMLSCRLPLGDVVKPVGLPVPGSYPSPGTMGNVTGWGLTSEGGSSSNQLMVISVPFVSQAVCNNLYRGKITNSMICAGELSGGKDSCQADSGGPLVVNNTQYGVVSWGNGCGRPLYPGVYANVVALRSWIYDKIGM